MPSERSNEVKKDWNQQFVSADEVNTRVYPKVSELAAWSEKCKWYSSLPVGAVASLVCESVQ
jgi:hypothetical protein